MSKTMQKVWKKDWMEDDMQVTLAMLRDRDNEDSLRAILIAPLFGGVRRKKSTPLINYLIYQGRPPCYRSNRRKGSSKK
jgi:hypothetical protein